jgi:hypothetical protein
MNRIIWGVFFLITIVLGCKHEPDAIIVGSNNNNNGGGNNGNTKPCDSNIVYFERDILPILNSNCAMSGCHDPGTAEEGVILNNYQNIIRTGKVVPYNTSSSDLYEVITETRLDKLMPPPPKSKLSPTQIALIAKWINQGAQNLYCDNGTCDTTNITYSGKVVNIIKNNCSGCHNATLASGGINVDNYQGLSVIAANGKLVGSIEGLQGFIAMPQGRKLDSCSIKQIKIWVNKGYPNN